jgi:ABC-type transport system involved in cytochrome c biogenesis permease subunit
VLSLIPAFDPGQRQSSLTVNGSIWIFLHIALVLAAYAALFLSLLASVLYLVQERRLKQKKPGIPWLPLLETPLDVLDQIAHKTLLFGFPCMTAGLLIGSLVAQLTIGVSYFRDPKILLAFAMWLAYVAMIFIRRQSGLRGRRAVYLSSFVFLVVLTVWAANQFSAVHRFTTP